MSEKVRSFIAVSLLIAFTWVTVPSSVVHAMIANHHDTECSAPAPGAPMTLASPHTHCDLLITQSLTYALPEFRLPDSGLPVVMTVQGSFHCSHASLGHRHFPGLRGPPALV